jgi:hypothetical protein
MPIAPLHSRPRKSDKLQNQLRPSGDVARYGPRKVARWARDLRVFFGGGKKNGKWDKAGMKFTYLAFLRTSRRFSYSMYPLILFVSLVFVDCARMKQNMASYDAEVKARQPKPKYIAKTKELEIYRLVTVQIPITELKVVYKAKEELSKILEAKTHYKKMDDSEKNIELKMIPTGGLVKVMEKNYEPGNEYTVELFANRNRIGTCSNDLSASIWDDYDPDVEYAVTYSDPSTPGGIDRMGSRLPNIKVSCPVNIPNPDTLYIHVSKNGSTYAVYQLTILK